MQKTLFIVRGVPGSGKTSFCRKQLVPLCRWSYGVNVVNREADDYFTGTDGVYRWDPKLLPQAHALCQQRVREDLGRDGVAIVSNTSVLRQHLEPYFTMAHELGAEVVIIRLRSRFHSVHGVPDEIIDRMATNMEACAGEILLG